MNRRKFIKNTGILSALSVLPVKLKAAIVPTKIKAVAPIVAAAPSIVSKGIISQGSIARLLQEGINEIAKTEYKAYESDFEAYRRGSNGI